MNQDESIFDLIADLRSIVCKLEERFPGRRFTLDGHLVGSIGEVLAAETYNLELYPNSHKTHDAKAPNGRQVQIKITQRRSIGISSEPEHLLVHKLHENGRYEEIYNGPGRLVWAYAKDRLQKNGQAQVSLSRLTNIMSQVEPNQRLTR